MTSATRSRLRRHPERAVEAAERARILDAGVVAHVAVVVAGEPLVLPLMYHHEGGRLYLHGSRASRLLRHLAGGARVCVGVTIVDDLIASRTAFNHSANYRSVTVFGRGRAVDDPQRKREIFDRMIARYFPGRESARDYAPPSVKELAVTTLVEVEVEEVSGKRRAGPPTGPTDGPDGDGGSYTCGLVAVGGALDPDHGGIGSR